MDVFLLNNYRHACISGRSGSSWSYNCLFLVFLLFYMRLWRGLCLFQSLAEAAFVAAFLANWKPLRWGWLSLSNHITCWSCRTWLLCPRRLSPRILCLHFLPVYGLCSPFMRHLPHSELSILTCCEEHVLFFVIMDHLHLLSERTLEHDYALTFLLNVSDLQVSVACPLTVAWHSFQPLEVLYVVFIVSAIRVDVLNYCWFHLSLVYELNAVDLALFHLANEDVPMIVQVQVFDEVIANVLRWLGSYEFNRVYHDRRVFFDIKEKNKAFLCSTVDAL